MSSSEKSPLKNPVPIEPTEMIKDRTTRKSRHPMRISQRLQEVEVGFNSSNELESVELNFQHSIQISPISNNKSVLSSTKIGSKTPFASTQANVTPKTAPRKRYTMNRLCNIDSDFSDEEAKTSIFFQSEAASNEIKSKDSDPKQIEFNKSIKQSASKEGRLLNSSPKKASNIENIKKAKNKCKIY